MKISLPGDKSISHRALMLAAIANGVSELRNLSRGVDVTSTRDCLAQCGIAFTDKKGVVMVNGQGGSFSQPSDDLDAGNSGTTARLLMGLLVGRGIKARLVGDVSLSRRPMARVVEPLRQLGAQMEISARQTLPVVIGPSQLGTLDYTMPMASAQVKSALLLAGLVSEGGVRVTEPVATRNHTELMLEALGVDIKVAGHEITIGAGVQGFSSFELDIPGDLSSAAFPAALATLVPDRDVTFPGLLLNPSRLGFFRALKRMGARVDWTVEKRVLGEEVGRLRVRSSTLKGITIRGDEIPTLIDEIPILAILACSAQGETVIWDAGELRLKECDRIKAIVENLRKMGARVQELADGFRILGSSRLRGATITTHSDHRIAMAFTVAGKITREKTTIDDPDCVEISFPGYHKLISRIKA